MDSVEDSVVGFCCSDVLGWHFSQVLGKKTAKGRGRPAAVGSSTPKRLVVSVLNRESGLWCHCSALAPVLSQAEDQDLLSRWGQVASQESKIVKG
jgi:hypothetical protein